MRTRRIHTGLLGLSLLLAPIALSAQNHDVTGTVNAGDSQQPLSGVSVAVVGRPTLSTTTNERGQYRLSVPAGTQELLFRHIGYKRRTAAVGPAQAVINAALDKDVLELEGVS